MERDIDESEGRSPGAEFEVLGRLLLSLSAWATYATSWRDSTTGPRSAVASWSSGWKAPRPPKCGSRSWPAGCALASSTSAPRTRPQTRHSEDSPETRLFLHVRGVQVEL